MTLSAGNVTSVKVLDGDITFKLPDQSECVKFCADGRVFVRGEHVDTNQEIWAGMKVWLQSATAYHP